MKFPSDIEVETATSVREVLEAYGLRTFSSRGAQPGKYPLFTRLTILRALGLKKDGHPVKFLDPEISMGEAANEYYEWVHKLPVLDSSNELWLAKSEDEDGKVTVHVVMKSTGMAIPITLA